MTIVCVETMRRACVTKGAISAAELAAIYLLVSDELRAGPGTFLDLGSHAGKSACVAAAAMRNLGRDDEFVCVDPLYDLTNEAAWRLTFQKSATNLPWGYPRREGFVEGVRALVGGLCPERVRLIGDVSQSVLSKWREPLAYVFVDSDDHAAPLVRWETEALLPFLLPGALLLYHDFGNQFSGPSEAYEYALSTGLVEEVRPDWATAEAFSIFHDLEPSNDSWHNRETAQPKFVGCLRRIGVPLT